MRSQLFGASDPLQGGRESEYEPRTGFRTTAGRRDVDSGFTTSMLWCFPDVKLLIIAVLMLQIHLVYVYMYRNLCIYVPCL